MPNRVEVHLDGIDNLKRKFRRLSGPAATEIMDDAVKAGAEIVEASAKMNAPIRTGALRRSIGIDKPSSPTGSVAYLVGSSLFYSRFVEFGTMAEVNKADWLTFPVDGRWAKVKAVNIPAKPWLRPAFKENLGHIEHTMRRVIQRGLAGAVR